MMSPLKGNYISLKDRAFFSIKGPDAERYLNGQISQSLSKATSTEATFTCVTNAKGKLQGVGFVREWEGGYLIDCPVELRESLFQRLDMYLIADDAELVDITDSITMFHCVADETPSNTWTSNRIGVAGYDTFDKPEGEEISHGEVERCRISHAMPKWGTELSEEILPPEARLQDSAISYTKGCYTGQEVISRMKSSGKVNKLLSSFVIQGEINVPQDIPNPEKPDGKPAGCITSITFEGERQIGIGYLNRKFQEEKNFAFDEISLNVIS